MKHFLKNVRPMFYVGVALLIADLYLLYKGDRTFYLGLSIGAMVGLILFELFEYESSEIISGYTKLTELQNRTIKQLVDEKEG